MRSCPRTALPRVGSSLCPPRDIRRRAQVLRTLPIEGGPVFREDVSIKRGGPLHAVTPALAIHPDELTVRVVPRKRRPQEATRPCSTQQSRSSLPQASDASSGATQPAIFLRTEAMPRRSAFRHPPRFEATTFQDPPSSPLGPVRSRERKQSPGAPRSALRGTSVQAPRPRTAAQKPPAPQS